MSHRKAHMYYYNSLKVYSSILNYSWHTYIIFRTLVPNLIRIPVSFLFELIQVQSKILRDFKVWNMWMDFSAWKSYELNAKRLLLFSWKRDQPVSKGSITSVRTWLFNIGLLGISGLDWKWKCMKIIFSRLTIHISLNSKVFSEKNVVCKQQNSNAVT